MERKLIGEATAGFYLTRSGNIEEVEYSDRNGVWCIVNKLNNRSWTEFGAYSEHVQSSETYTEEYYRNEDLILRITKEDNPEYFL